jgi:ubiquinone/menaquinone biosynthesis C-methylase UbiE
MDLPEGIRSALVESVLVDAIARRRAGDVLAKSGLDRYLPREGLLLDLGSGFGHVAEAIQHNARDRFCVMMDYVSVPVGRVARRIASLPCVALKGDGRQLPFRDSTFDGALACFVLHHVAPEGQSQILAEVARVLRAGTTFVLVEDTPGNARQANATLCADRRLNFEAIDAPHHYRSQTEWRAELARHGFSIEQEIPFRRLFPPVTFAAVQHTSFVCRRG